MNEVTYLRPGKPENTRETVRPIRCHHFRVTTEPCMEPATVEVLGPYPTLYCEEHARQRLEENIGERWEHVGVEEYARDCEAAASKLRRWMREADVGVTLYEILEEARTYLEKYELRRARAQLMAQGGTPRPTEGELHILEHFRECAQKYGWTDQPHWVTELEAWMDESSD